MLPRKETKFIVVTATMTDDRIPVREIEWRARKYGYLDIGCHYVIEGSDHTITTTCRPDNLIGVGVKPHNDSSIIITLSGSAPFTDGQLIHLGMLCDGLIEKYPNAQVVAHSDLKGARSQAPGFDVQAWWAGWQATKAL